MNENFAIGAAGAISGFAALLTTVYFGHTVSEGFGAFALVTMIVTVGLFWRAVEPDDPAETGGSSDH